MWRQRVAFGRYALAVTAPGGAGARGGGRAGSVSREARTWSSRRGRAARGTDVDGILKIALTLTFRRHQDGKHRTARAPQ